MKKKLGNSSFSFTNSLCTTLISQKMWYAKTKSCKFCENAESDYNEKGIDLALP